MQNLKISAIFSVARLVSSHRVSISVSSVFITFHHDTPCPNLLLYQLIFISHLAVSVQVTRRNSVKMVLSQGQKLFYCVSSVASAQARKPGVFRSLSKGPIGALGSTDQLKFTTKKLLHCDNQTECRGMTPNLQKLVKFHYAVKVWRLSLVFTCKVSGPNSGRNREHV